MDQIGFGLIGCGIFGEIHARMYDYHPSVRFKAACDIKQKRAEEIVEHYHAETYYTDYHELIGDETIKAVSIATPDFAHTDIVIDSLKAGKAVLVEKPLATTLEECEKIVEVQASTGAKLMVDFANRWNPPFVHIREMVKTGELGIPRMIYIRLNNTIYVPTEMLSWASKSSVAHFLGSHAVDLIRWITGAEAARVYAVSRSEILKKRGIDTPDYFQSIIELTNGATAVVENCWIVDEHSPSVFDFKCEVIGTKGSAFTDSSHHRAVETFSSKGAALPDVLGATIIHSKPGGFAMASIEHFIDCVVNDTTPMVTEHDGYMAAQIVSAIEESARKGIPVEVTT